MVDVEDFGFIGEGEGSLGGFAFYSGL